MQIKALKGPDMVPPIVYIRGEFFLWNRHIPYFVAAVPWETAREHFSLLDDLAGSALEEWSIAELFQRDIDWPRIKSELGKYLKEQNHPHFFNALTIALLPKDGDSLGAEYSKDDTVYPSINEASLEKGAVLGGVQLQPYKESNGMAGQLRWDRRRIVAVAVDGQHRLASIKYVDQGIPAANREASSVPVIFILPHQDAGFSLPVTPKGVSPISVTLRQIFIDLNKHAKRIPPAREILLDDHDVHRVCLRRLLGDRLDDKKSTARIPLGAVDWLSEKNKIDGGPFLTTVLLLELAVIEALGRREVYGDFVGDSDSEVDGIDDELKRCGDWLKVRFSPSAKQLEDLLKNAQGCLEQGVRVVWNPEHLKVLADLFERKWGPPLVRLFREVTAYSTIWEYGEKEKLHGPEFVTLYKLWKVEGGSRALEKARELEDELRRLKPGWTREKRFVEPLKKIEELKEGKWPFMVVFQRAMVRSFVQLRSQREAFFSSGKGTDEAYVDLWIKAANVLLESPLGQVEAKLKGDGALFWEGIGLKAGGGVDFGGGGCERLSRWMSAWVCMYAAKVTKSDAVAESAGEIAERLLKLRPVRKGLEDLASAKANGKLSESKLEERVEALLESRVDRLRSLLK